MMLIFLGWFTKNINAVKIRILSYIYKIAKFVKNFPFCSLFFFPSFFLFLFHFVKQGKFEYHFFGRNWIESCIIPNDLLLWIMIEILGMISWHLKMMYGVIRYVFLRNSFSFNLLIWSSYVKISKRNCPFF